MLNDTQLKRLSQALAFAAHKHRDQRRKDPEASPYINHPIALLNVLVTEAGISDIDTLCAALLHDTIEDTETSAEELRAAFGDAVCDIVLEVTDDKNLEKAERKRRQVEHAPHLSTRAQAVKIADKIANLRDVAQCPPGDWDLARQQAYFDWAMDVVDAMPDGWADLKTIFFEEYRNRP